MIYFAPAKINLGLQILERRGDGFHNLRSVMYPTGLCDIIEVNQQALENDPIQFTQSGISYATGTEENLCIRAWKLMASETDLPGVAIHLHKQIPVGAGLGGGSSDAATILKGLNRLAKVPLTQERLEELAIQLGSDCPFFLYNIPMMMEGAGELLSEVNISLRTYFLVILFPGIHISTASAYSNVIPAIPELHLRQLIEAPVDKWKGSIMNDFEEHTFVKYPLMKELKRTLYDNGAMYASMSGSGSSLYGIFERIPVLPAKIQDLVVWKGPA
jgi:4-diphosphocytidyl-2-C-methyl-D-erythritol kinase